MRTLVDHLKTLTRPRGLMAMALILSGLGVQGGRGTMAYFTSSSVSAASSFQGGTVDVATSSTLTTGTFAWTFAGREGTGATGTTKCSNVLTGTNSGDAQGMVPGQFCVAPITITNAGTNSVDAWLRMRLVRAASDGSTSATADSALNDRLRFYISEYSASTDGTTQTALATRDADCTTTNFRPSVANSTAAIANVTATAATGGRTALTSVGASGRNLGKHPGISADSTANTGATFGGTPPKWQNANVLALNTKGLALASTLATGQLPMESTMVTAGGSSRTAYNLVGNDEATNPVLTTSATTSHGAVRAGESGSTTYTTDPTTAGGFHPTNAESEIVKNTSRYYCAAIFFPSDTDTSYADVYSGIAAGYTAVNIASSTKGATTMITTATPHGLATGDRVTIAGHDLAGANGTWAVTVTSTTAFTIAVDTSAAAGNGTGVGTVTKYAPSLTDGNTQGDNATRLGTVKYYLTITAAQKAGRTDN